MLHFLIKDNRGSPLIEEALLVVLGLICILLLLGVLTGFFDWIWALIA
ncbi:MAG: hypothetical protein ACFFC7_25990 [Candidatus Hermodarchaeota archaeon]